MQAVILAGGKGTRLMPYTMVLPKPLMPIGDLPILGVLLHQLRAARFTEVILAVNYQAPLFKALIDQADLGKMRITYSIEDTPLGTAGGLSMIADKLDSHFMVLNGDILTTLDFDSFFHAHVKSQSAASIATLQRENKVDFGVLESDASGNLRHYIEKPVHAYAVSMGINMLTREDIKPFLASQTYLDIPTLLQQLVDSGKTVRCLSQKCRWLDIGRLEDYKFALTEFEENRAAYLQGDT